MDTNPRYVLWPQPAHRWPWLAASGHAALRWLPSDDVGVVLRAGDEVVVAGPGDAVSWVADPGGEQVVARAARRR